MEANIHDGQSRDVFYAENLQGEITQRDTGTSTGLGHHSNIVGPHARYYYFGGIRMGDVSNDGTSDVNYVTSITDHTLKPGNGLFQNGGTTETKYADFDASYEPINGLTYEDAPGSYTVQGGDTLQSIAQQIWGDSNFWYLLADANGLDLGDNLVAGQTLIVPNKVANNQNNNDTYRVYDPNDAIGNVSPTTPPKPSPHHGPACGVFGEILLAIVAVVVSVVTYGALTGPATTLLGSIEAGAIAGAAGSVASQTLGVITGIQKSFNWGAVALSAIGGAVGAGVGPSGANLFGSMSSSIGVDGVAALQGITSNVITQGIGVATGLQKSFDWAGVAAAGLSAGVIKEVGTDLGFNPGGTDSMNLAKGAVAGMAGLIVSAATRTLINGSDFGDNILKGLPDVIGQTIGSALEGQVNQQQLRQSAGSQIKLSQIDIPYQIPNVSFDDTPTAAESLGLDISDDAAPAAPPPPLPSAAQHVADAQADQQYKMIQMSLASVANGPLPPIPTLQGTALTAALTNVTQPTFGGYSVQPSDSSDPNDAVTLQIGVLNGGDPQAIVTQLSQLPRNALLGIQSDGIQFVAVQNSVVEYIPGLSGTLARAHDDGSMDASLDGTWDRTAGTYDYLTKAVVIATSGTYGTGSADELLHELGHAIDYAWYASHGTMASKSSAFSAAYNNAAPFDPLSSGDAYYTQAHNPDGYLSEAFAESFAETYTKNVGSGTTLTSNNDADFLPVVTAGSAGLAPLGSSRQSLVNYWLGWHW
jgi:hypothetical protein